jgi:hypothetical protein
MLKDDEMERNVAYFRFGITFAQRKSVGRDHFGTKLDLVPNLARMKQKKKNYYKQ